MTGDPFESAIRESAVAALRRRAARQAEIARVGAATTKAGVVIRTDKRAIAVRLAEALAAAADEIERLELAP